MNKYRFGQRSMDNLKDVHRALIDVTMRALEISPRDFAVINGMRTQEEQLRYFLSGKSKTMNSYHLTGHAVDLAVYVDGDLVWEPWEVYEDLAETMFQAAHIEGCVIEWGGHFAKVRTDGKLITFRDGLHFQLPRRFYPLITPNETGASLA